jgi:hypothetical protein
VRPFLPEGTYKGVTMVDYLLDNGFHFRKMGQTVRFGLAGGLALLFAVVTCVHCKCTVIPAKIETTCKYKLTIGMIALTSWHM